MLAVEKILCKNANIMKGTTTEAELVQQKTKNGELQPFNQQAKSSLMNCQVSWWIRNDKVWKKAFPRPGSTEKDICQPFVTKILQPFTEAIIPGASVGAAGYFNLGTRRYSDIELTSIVDNHAYRTVSFGSRKPDIVSYERGCTGVLGITFFGDVKRSGSGEFTDQEKGHILDMGFDLMDIQRGRPFLICYLTDGNRFQFFQIDRKEVAHTILSTQQFTAASLVGRYTLLIYVQYIHPYIYMAGAHVCDTMYLYINGMVYYCRSSPDYSVGHCVNSTLFP